MDADNLMARAAAYNASLATAGKRMAEAPFPDVGVEVDRPRSALCRVDVGDVMTALPKLPRFALDPWLPRRHVTLGGGHGGSGKTLLALVIAAHVAAGRDFAGFPVEQDRVAFVSLEDEPSLIRLRLRRVIECYGLPATRVLDNFTLLDGTAGCVLMTEGCGYGAPALLTAAYSDLRELVAGAGLVVIDNASDSFEGNENVRRSVRAFIRALAIIARENDAAVLLLAHIDKSAAKNGAQGNSYSGSTAWHNSCRSRLALVEDGTGLVLVQEKLNVGRCAEPLRLSRNEWGVPIPVVLGDLSAVAESDRETLVIAFQAADAIGLNVPATVTPGGHSAMAVLATLSEYPEALSSARQGRSRAAKTITSMARDGLLLVESYERAHRKKGKRYVLREDLRRTRAVTPEYAPDSGRENSAPDKTKNCAALPPNTPVRSGATAQAPVAPAPILDAQDGRRMGAGWAQRRKRDCPKCAGEGCPHCEAKQ
jgi:hypothetical protein